MTVGEKFQEVQELIGKISDIYDRPMKYALDDLKSLKRDAERLSSLMDEIEYEVKDYVPTKYTQPDDYAQVELHQELKEAI